jgi:uncharacterized protein YggE
MNRILKNVIPVVGAVAVLALACAALIYAVYYGRSIEPSSYRSFSVSGDGKSVSVPDVAQFSFTVITEGGKDLAALQRQNTEASNKAIAFVKGNGVADKDIKTSYYNVDPRYENYSCYDAPVSVPTRDESAASGSGGSAVSSTPPAASSTKRVCPPPSIVGYTVTQSVGVKIRDFSKVGDIMTGVVTNGANRVGSLSFTLDDPTSVQDEARAQAIAKAKAKAQGIARAGGFTLGRLLNISENGNYPYAYKSVSSDMAYGMGGSVESAPAPSIEPGSQDTSVTVTLTYEIK